jgi:hypothetical protein
MFNEVSLTECTIKFNYPLQLYQGTETNSNHMHSPNNYIKCHRLSCKQIVTEKIIPRSLYMVLISAFQIIQDYRKCTSQKLMRTATWQWNSFTHHSAPFVISIINLHSFITSEFTTRKSMPPNMHYSTEIARNGMCQLLIIPKLDSLYTCHNWKIIKFRPRKF